MFVFRIFAFVLVFKCLITSVYSEPELETTALKPNLNGTIREKAADSTQSRNDTKIPAPIIIGEGGQKIVLNEKSTTEPSDNLVKVNTTPRTYGREGELVEDPRRNKSSNLTKEDKLNRTSISTSTEESKPVSESPTAEKSLVTEETVTVNTQPTKPHSRIVPKKGVNYNATASTSQDNFSTTLTNLSTTTTTTVQPTTTIKSIRKPTLTIGSNDEKDALVKEKMNNSIPITPKVPTIEYYQKKKEDNKRSAFIIPIVAVILSVPIVAIVLNILYKRCKEWWSHRHYSRMDFLIDGMYNN